MRKLNTEMETETNTKKTKTDSETETVSTDAVAHLASTPTLLRIC